jgi:hypothetical protein
MAANNNRLSSSVGTSASFGAPLRKGSKIALLSELHRPLEDHWRHGQSSRGLDPVNSDFIYKLHITKLQHVYAGNQLDETVKHTAKPLAFVNQSPVTQLYGTHGLLTKLPEKVRVRKEERKEKGWDSYFTGKSEYGRGGGSGPDSLRSSRPRTAGADRSDRHSQYNTTGTRREDEDVTPLEHVRHRYNGIVNREMYSEDVTLLGLYTLTEEQQKVYAAFVEMMSQFDPHDQRNIIRDALLDAREKTCLDGFSGTELQ